MFLGTLLLQWLTPVAFLFLSTHVSTLCYLLASPTVGLEKFVQIEPLYTNLSFNVSSWEDKTYLRPDSLCVREALRPMRSNGVALHRL